MSMSDGNTSDIGRSVPSREPTSNDQVKEQLASSVTDLARLAEAVAENQFDRPNPFGTSFWAEHFGVSLDAEPDEVREAHDESILSVDVEIVASVVYGTGGPHTEIEITFSGEGDVLRGRAVGYWSSTEQVRHLASEVAESYAEALGLWESVSAQLS